MRIPNTPGFSRGVGSCFGESPAEEHHELAYQHIPSQTCGYLAVHLRFNGITGAVQRAVIPTTVSRRTCCSGDRSASRRRDDSRPDGKPSKNRIFEKRVCTCRSIPAALYGVADAMVFSSSLDSRASSLPSSTKGGAVVIRSMDVYAIRSGKKSAESSQQSQGRYS